MLIAEEKKRGGVVRQVNDRADRSGVLGRIEEAILGGQDMTDYPVIESALSHIAFSFGGGLGKEDRRFLVHCMERHIVNAGECLWREGEANDRVGLLVRGRVKLVKEVEGTKHPLILGLLGAGAGVIDPAFLEGRARQTSAHVVEEVAIFYLSRRHFQRMLEERPTLGERILGAAAVSFAGQLRHAYRRLSVFY